MSLQPSVPSASAEPSAPASANGPVVHAAAGASPNGSPLAKASHLPKARRGKKTARLLIPTAILLLGGAAFAGYWFFGRETDQHKNLIHEEVKRRPKIQFKVVERGTLEAKDNHNITCEVKTGSRGAPKIKDVVENGTIVKEGDLLVVIDDSYLQEQATNQKIARDKAEQDQTAAKLLLPGKETAVAVALQNKEKWIKGDYLQQLHDLEGQIQTSESNLLQEEDRLAWVSRMVKKKYMTASQEEAEQALLMGNKLDLQKKQEQKKVLTDYTNPTTISTMEKAISDAKNDLETAQKDKAIKDAVFKQQDDLYKDLEAQIKQCKVTATHSGIVVYYVPEQTRMGSGSNQSIIAQGEPVQYGQKMMSIPDLSHMLVNVRIHEAFVGHLEVKARVEKVHEGGPADKAGLKTGDVITGLNGKPIKSFSDLAEVLRSTDLSSRAKLKVLRDKKEIDAEITFAQHSDAEKGAGEESEKDAKDDPAAKGGKVEEIGAGKVKDNSPNRLFGVKFQVGLPAEIRVDAAPGKVFRGHVKSIASVAAQQDWMSPDVKVYQAYVEIDDSVKELKLKPGLSAVCTILTETEAENVLAVPVQCIIPATSPGGDAAVMVLGPKGPERRNVKLLKVDGKLMTDGGYVAIEDGLTEGEEIVQNPTALTGDKDKKSGKDGEKGGPGGPGDGMPGGKGKGKGGPGGPGGPPGGVPNFPK
jgi:multidrug efflux pump subunit AcrA (membrane-fusion protein)